MANVTFHNEGWNTAFYASGNTGQLVFTHFNVMPSAGHMISAAAGSQCGNRAPLTMDGCNFIVHTDDAMNTLAISDQIFWLSRRRTRLCSPAEITRFGDTVEIWNSPSFRMGIGRKALCLPRPQSPR